MSCSSPLITDRFLHWQPSCGHTFVPELLKLLVVNTESKEILLENNTIMIVIVITEMFQTLDADDFSVNSKQKPPVM